MVSQVLQIHSTPVRWRMEVQNAKVQANLLIDPPRMQTSHQEAKITMHTKNTQVLIDTTEMRASMNLKNISRVLSEAAQRGRQAAMQATAELSSFGSQLGRIDQGVQIPQLVGQQIRQREMPNSYTVFIPSVGPDLSWDPATIQGEYQPAQYETQWQLDKNVMEYIPGKAQLIIEQLPRVDIEYTGSPNYVPPSSAPDYSE